MANVFGKEYSRIELMKLVGDVSQIAGIKKLRLEDGYSAGVESYQIKTGTGLSFSVLASRGLDISYADWCGKSLSWISSTGEVAPQFFEPQGLGWLRGFYGGLVATCGLTYAGAPNLDEGIELGLHGRASYTPAHNVSFGGEWVGDDYEMFVSGKMRESVVFGENVVLTRKISARLGEDRIKIEDSVENEGHSTTPHMILYHINGGFPAVAPGSEMLSPTLAVVPRDKDAEVEIELSNKFGAPAADFKERVYYHNLGCEADGTVVTALVNREICGGFGFYIEYSKNQLPFFNQWKMTGLGSYVVGMEPANCHVEGRANERKLGTLQYLEPGEVRKYQIEIGVVCGEESVEALRDRIERMKEGND